MWTSNIQVGADLATAASVVVAAIVYIRDIRNNRKAELKEQKKERNQRRNEFKLEKASEMIGFLTEKEYQMRHVCDQIDARLRLMKNPELAAGQEVVATKKDRSAIYDAGVAGALDYRFVPEDYRISGKIRELLKLLREVASYLDRNPFIKYLLDDAKVNEKVENIIRLNELHGTFANKEATQRKTLTMIVGEFETHPTALGVHIYANIKAGRNVVPEGEHVAELKEIIANQGRKITRREEDKLYSRAYQAEFMTLGDAAKKAKIYRNFVIKRLEALARKRPMWMEIPDAVNDVTGALGDFSYAKVSDSEG